MPLNNTIKMPRKSAPDRPLKAMLAAMCVLVLLGSTAGLYYSRVQLASVAPVKAVELPALPVVTAAAADTSGPILDDSDVALYNEIVAAQKKANWSEADRLLASVRNPVLVGSLQADRFLHAKYTTRFEELSNWLANNEGNPDADAIRSLARSKFPKDAKNLPAVKSGSFSPRAIEEGKASILRVVDFSLDDSNPLAQRAANKAMVTLETKSVDEALNIINSAHARKVIGNRTRAILIGRLASHQFKRGNFTRAYQLASSAASYEKPFAAHQWLAGISAVHMKQPQTAARHFAKIAKRDDIPVADVAAGSYWASIMYRKTNDTLADQMLANAAQYDRTFYGLLANKALGLSISVSQMPTLDDDALLELPAVQRAAAWVALRKTAAAETELTRLFSTTDDLEVKRQVIALASKWNMPVLQMKMGAVMRAENKERLDYAMYPTPGWKPNAGYAVDPALLYAIARQESQFDVDARSPAGAMGVMQLMPGTAHYVAKNSFTGAERVNIKGRLNEPVTNIALGQEYLQYLMTKPYIDNNLMFVAAAYNAGPGKLSEWVERIDDQNNPLLFLESISFTETRNYVQQVFVNYWVYSELMGDESPTLSALASNEWPLYKATNLEFAGLFEGQLY